MSKKGDLVQILTIIIIGMFIPFLGALVITFKLDITKLPNLLKIFSTFGYFLLIFAIELIVVYIYFRTTSNIANKKIKDFKISEEE